MEETDPGSVFLTKADIEKLKVEFSNASVTEQNSLILHLALLQVVRVHDSIIHAGDRAVRATLLAFRITFAIYATDASRPDFETLLRICAHAKKHSRAKHIRNIEQMVKFLANGKPEAALEQYFDGSKLVSTLPSRTIWKTIGHRSKIGDETKIPDEERCLFILSVIGLHLVRNSTWRFWEDWLRSFSNRRAKAPAIRAEVIAIDDSFWDLGPEAVAAEIERIEAEFLEKRTPQAEGLEFNAETGKFLINPIEVVKPDLLAATVSQAQDALDDVLASPSNGLHERSREARVLRRAFGRYGNDPQQIEMGFVSVHKGLTRQIVVAEELPASEENLALMDALEEGARAIRATHPKVEENRKIINEQSIKELPEGAKATLEKALPVLVAISDDNLANDWRTDIPQLINDATEPLVSGAPPLPGVDETMRIFSRAAKIGLRMRVKGVVDKIKATPEYSVVEITTRIAALISLGILLISFIF